MPSANKIDFNALVYISIFTESKDDKLYEEFYLLSLLWGYWRKLGKIKLKFEESTNIWGYNKMP